MGHGAEGSDLFELACELRLQLPVGTDISK